MPATIVATVGSTSANSFVTVAEMSAYCDSRLTGGAWTEDDSQTNALVKATRDLTVLEYVGTRVTNNQALAWPRDWAINPDKPSVEYVGNIELMYYGATEIPQRIKDATCELALQYLLAGSNDLASADNNQGVIEKTVDVLTTTWASPQARPTGLGRFPRVQALLYPLLLNAGAGISLVRM